MQKVLAVLDDGVGGDDCASGSGRGSGDASSSHVHVYVCALAYAATPWR